MTTTQQILEMMTTLIYADKDYANVDLGTTFLTINHHNLGGKCCGDKIVKTVMGSYVDVYGYTHDPQPRGCYPQEMLCNLNSKVGDLIKLTTMAEQVQSDTTLTQIAKHFTNVQGVVSFGKFKTLREIVINMSTTTRSNYWITPTVAQRNLEKFITFMNAGMEMYNVNGNFMWLVTDDKKTMLYTSSIVNHLQYDTTLGSLFYSHRLIVNNSQATAENKTSLKYPFWLPDTMHNTTVGQVIKMFVTKTGGVDFDKFNSLSSIFNFMSNNSHVSNYWLYKKGVYQPKFAQHTKIDSAGFTRAKCTQSRAAMMPQRFNQRNAVSSKT